MTLTKEFIKALDQNDPLSAYQNEFHVTDKDLCYLDGNSLGRLPLKSIEKISSFLKDEWGSELVEGLRLSTLALSNPRRPDHHHHLGIGTRVGIAHVP